MTTLACSNCGGSLAPSFYREPPDGDSPTRPRAMFYTCPLCGPGVHCNPPEAEPAAEPPRSTVSA